MSDFGLVRLASGLAIALAVAVGGCSPGDVEINGKIFDALGVSSASATKKEPKLAARPGLVLPPNPEALPDPSAVPPPPVVAVEDPAWPKDADETRHTAAADSARRHDEFCKKGGNWRERAMADEVGATSGPGGNCNGNIFSAIFGKATSSGDD